MSIHQFSAQTIAGEDVSLADYAGQVVLIVNTASKCGFTPQYTELEALYQEYKDQGFSVLGFPCNQFRNQEPGTNEEIQSFCQINFGVTFPLFAKIAVNGSDTHPLFAYLKEQAPGTFGQSVKWNFTKFLVNREGEVVSRFAPTTKPSSLRREIEALLN